jgi:hypothetical protein
MRADPVAHGDPSGPALIGAQDAVVVRVATGEAFGEFGLDLGDDDRTAPHALTGVTRFAAVASPMTGPVTRRAVTAVVGAARSPMTGAISASLADGLELGAADLAVAVGVQTAEMSRSPFGATGLRSGAQLLCADRAVVIRIQGGQAADAGLHEFGLGDGLNLTRSDRGRGRGRRGLGHGRPPDQGGEGNGGQTAGDDRLLHASTPSGETPG